MKAIKNNCNLNQIIGVKYIFHLKTLEGKNTCKNWQDLCKCLHFGTERGDNRLYQLHRHHLRTLHHTGTCTHLLCPHS